ncbi:putative CP [Chimpanzee faeces associated circular DNA virus 1]|uniref:putative CP n=1 Tax=Chimpanzee faeces associated circular DNA virus 1 TaxID=1676184 RepID=UPI0007FB5E7A|nr:putative CP [Chimpanzee faeces associated circular DNA virus 1]AKO71488.1 putative CP [Chimpanzee faeces associated circular DNA virus 1]
MAYSTFYKNRFSAYRRARSSRRWNSGSRRRAWGNSKAARQQRDAATVTISRIATTQVTVLSGTQTAAEVINHWNNLRLSTYFGNYAPMYDQMKLDKIRIKVTGSQSGTAMTANWSPSIVLAFDRNGLTTGQQMTSDVVSTYSSAQLKQWSTGNAFTMYQTIYPSTIMEKGMYIPTESLQDPLTVADATNPCYNYASSTLPFKPLTLLAVDMGGNLESSNTFAFTIEYEYTVTFRGMRKPSLSYVSSVVTVDSFGAASTKFPFSSMAYAAENISVTLPTYTLLLAFNTEPDDYIEVRVYSSSNTTLSITVPGDCYYGYISSTSTNTLATLYSGEDVVLSLSDPSADRYPTILRLSKSNYEFSIPN